jgi:hypothetical protein
MLRSTIKASRLFVPRPFLRPANPPQILSCIRQSGPGPSSLWSARRSMAVAANATPADAPLITPGTPVSTPTLIDIDKRWLDLNAQQQLDIFKALHEREKEPWYTMTTEERKACMPPTPRHQSPLFSVHSLVSIEADCAFWEWSQDGLTDGVVYYINFGPHGPRAQRRKEGWEIFGTVATLLAISFTIFYVIRQYRTSPQSPPHS